MVSFEQARAIALAAIAPDWQPKNGRLITSENGYEDDRFWWIVAGAAEWLNDHDPDFQQLDVPALLVNKETGELIRLSVTENLERLGEMTPV